MLQLVALAALWFGSVPPEGSPHPATSAHADPRVLKALEVWLAAWRRGKIELAGEGARADLGAKSIARQAGALPPGILGTLTPRRELEVLLEQAVALDSRDAAEHVLQIAAAGMDGLTCTPAMAPMTVRTIGEDALAKFTNPEVKDYVLRIARGDDSKRSDKEEQRALQAAALRGLGRFGEASFRPALEQQLSASVPLVRRAAVDGLRLLGTAASVDPLLRMIEHENSEIVLEAAAGALQEIMTRHHALIETQVQQAAVDVVVGALGRCDWRSDLALVAFLEKFRSRSTIPALIDVLQRFIDSPDDIRSGKLSGLLRFRAHETLMALTGAFHPIDRPDEWRAFWEREKDRLQVVTPESKPPEDPDKVTVSTGFFGIPVRGTRVVFVVDLSGSMDFDMGAASTRSQAPGKAPKRLDYAKVELIRAIEALPPETSFNLISFNGNPKAKAWQKDLVPANRVNKKKFIEFVQELRADGGTNTWSGLEQALQIKSFVYGQRYLVELDELFVLSDGIPTVGDVVDAREILNLVAETNRFSKLRINTVYIAGQLTERDRETERLAGMTGEKFMRLLAEENGGKAISL